MHWIRPKRSALRLDESRHLELQQQVLRRDSWRGQVCGSSSTLQVHHEQPRCRQGENEESNLITLCADVIKTCTLVTAPHLPYKITFLIG